jgi:hypothetical protein
MVVLGLVATAGILSLHGVVGGERESKNDSLEMPLRIAQLDHQAVLPKLWPYEAVDDLDCDDSSLLVSRGSLSRLVGERWPLQAAGTVTQVAVGQGEQGHTAEAGERAEGTAREGEWLTMSITVFSCRNDTTGEYACEPGVFAGACPGYVLNPGTEGPGVTGPSLYVAAGPSWPCGTEFELSTGQRVIVADRGGKVHDRHLDAWCLDANNREMCLPGIGASVEVMVVP